jgi:rhamnulokinase
MPGPEKTISPRARRFAGVDLGAASGRVMLGVLDEGRLSLTEAHRFPNQPVRLGGMLCWDLPELLAEVRKGLARAAALAGGRLDGIGVDSWGVDFGLLDAAGKVIANPVHYRDPCTQGVMARVLARIPRETVFAETGIQFLEINTLYQLAALKERDPGKLASAAKLLLIADLIHHQLTGRAVQELTLATTTQMWNPARGGWSEPVLAAVGIPRELLPEVVPPGTAIAPLKEDVARTAGLPAPPPVIAPACHDTACAVAAVPAAGGPGWAYLSSGTWSLAGIELAAPRLTAGALAGNFTNEGGAAGTTRFLRNLTGLWLVQECRRSWAGEGGEGPDYGDLSRLAREAGPSAAWIDPADPAFFAPADMPEAIRGFARRTRQRPPATRGEIVRCALESLALSYRRTLDDVRAVAGVPIDRLHVVGGGARERLLDQLTADALGIPVLAGPVEATALGNILIQAMAAGAVGSLAEARRIVRDSTESEEFAPRERAAWEAKYARYQELVTR